MLEQKVRAFMETHMTDAFQPVIVAYSGGKDSACLLSCLSGMPDLVRNLSAVHVNHGIREASSAEEAFCADFCRERGIPLKIYHVQAKKKAEEEHCSLEDAARKLRYACFYDAAGKSADRGASEEETVDGGGFGSIVVTAHHALDQAETVLLHLLRGSGLKGLGGMQEVRDIFWRPMLSVTPEEIEKYLTDHEVPHVEDESNAELCYARNRIRHQLIPLLKSEYNEEIVDVLCRMSGLLREDEELLRDLVPEERSPVLDIRHWEEQKWAFRARRLRSWIEHQMGLVNVEQKHIDALDDLALGLTGRCVDLPGGLTVQKSYDILFFQGLGADEAHLSGQDTKSRLFTEVIEAADFWKDHPEGVPDLVMEKWIGLNGSEDLRWRTRKEGDFILIRKKDENGQTCLGRQKLQDLFINQKVPREIRKNILMLTDGSHVLWVPGFRMSEGAYITADTQKILHCRMGEEGEKHHV